MGTDDAPPTPPPLGIGIGPDFYSISSSFFVSTITLRGLRWHGGSSIKCEIHPFFDGLTSFVQRGHREAISDEEITTGRQVTERTCSSYSVLRMAWRGGRLCVSEAKPLASLSGIPPLSLSLSLFFLPVRMSYTAHNRLSDHTHQ